MLFILVNFLELKLDKFRNSNDSHLKNISSILVICGAYKFDKLTDFKDLSS